MSSKENQQPTTSSQEKSESSSQFRFQDNALSGNQGTITIAERVKNKYKTVNKVIKKNPIIGVIMVFLFLLGLLVGVAVISPFFSPDSKQVTSSTNKNVAKDDIPVDENIPVNTDTYTVQRELTKYEKTAIQYLLEATSTNVSTKKLSQLGGCEDVDCVLVNEFYDNNQRLVASIPEMLTKRGIYYVGSDIGNQVPEDEMNLFVYILIPPVSMSSTKGKEPEGSNASKYYPHSNLVVINLSTDDNGKLTLNSYDPYSTGGYNKYYKYPDFMSSEIGQLITSEANLDWRAVDVQSKAKFE